MKKVLHFFSKTGEERRAPERRDPAATYLFKEPTLGPPSGVHPQRAPSAARQQDAANQARTMPTDFAGIVAFFEQTVAERKSPYNALVRSADRLKEFIPDEISRLKAAYALCEDRWSPEALSLAISTHISDIDLARSRAESSKHDLAAQRTVELRKQADQLKEKNSKIQQEINALNESIGRLQGKLDANSSAIASLNDQIQTAEADANSGAFLDQAAENLKSDLLAKKVILGLP